MPGRRTIKFDGISMTENTRELQKATDRVLVMNEEYKGLIYRKDWNLKLPDNAKNTWLHVSSTDLDRHVPKIYLKNCWDNIYPRETQEADKIDIEEGDWIKITAKGNVDVVYT